MDLVEAQKRGFTTSERHPWELARLKVLKKLILKNVILNDKAIVVDIGCGDTFVVEELARDYPKASFHAIDIAFTDEMIKKYSENLIVKNVFLYRSVEEFTLKVIQSASLILLADVIEHIEDDIKFMNELIKNKFIDNKTLFLITVPAYQSLFCSHDIFLGHYRRYTNTKLKINLSIAGLSVTNMGYFFFGLLPIRIFQVLKEKMFGFDMKKISTGLTTWQGGKAKASILKNILLWDTYFTFSFKKLGVNFPGLSNYAICKKSV